MKDERGNETTARVELLRKVGKGIVHQSRRRGGRLVLVARTIESPSISRFYPYHEGLNPNRGKLRGPISYPKAPEVPKPQEKRKKKVPPNMLVAALASFGTTVL